MTPGALLAMKGMVKIGPLAIKNMVVYKKLDKDYENGYADIPDNEILISSQRVQDSTKKSYTYPDSRRSGKTIVVRGKAGYMKRINEKEFGKMGDKLNAMKIAAYKAPTMRNNIKKGRRK